MICIILELVLMVSHIQQLFHLIDINHSVEDDSILSHVKLIAARSEIKNRSLVNSNISNNFYRYWITCFILNWISRFIDEKWVRLSHLLQLFSFFSIFTLQTNNISLTVFSICCSCRTYKTVIDLLRYWFH